MRIITLFACAGLLAGAAPAQKIDMAARLLPAPPATLGATVKPFVKHGPGRIAITHVRVIDGTGAAPLEDRTVLIDGTRIAAVQAGGETVPNGYAVIDGTGKSFIPGIVGMHNHLFYIALPGLDAAGKFAPPVLVPQMTFSAPRLYLAGGVTTIRTTGSVEPYADLNLKAQIDAGVLPGPHVDVTGPYLEGAGSPFIQMHPLKDAADATQTVNYWADRGVTSFKAYINISRAALKAAIDAAHARGIKVTGHLCSVSYPEAVALGIDDFEHGFWVNTQNDPGKMPDQCSKDQGEATLSGMATDRAEARALIKLLVDHKVAVTSTLPVFETYAPGYRTLPPRQLEMLLPEARGDYFYNLTFQKSRSAAGKAIDAKLWANALALERAFVAAGGLLIAGPDPAGAGNVLPGFGDQRAIELLVEAGFTPLEAIRIATLNGATYLGVADRIGSIAAGKNADLVLVDGNPATRIADIEKVVTVFKDGIGYDSTALQDSVRGRYGQY